MKSQHVLPLVLLGAVILIGSWAASGGLPSPRPAEAAPASDPDPLPSWKDGPARRAILQFVRDTTDRASSKYVRPEDRIATFDQDGTLWVEQPIYTEAMFALDRVRALAAEHPEWKDQEPFKAYLADDQKAMVGFDEHDWGRLVAATHSGMTIERFRRIVRDWLARAKHPRFKRPYTELVYQPMLEVLQYLRANHFKTYIVTGSGQEFVRAYAQSVYGIVPEHVIGSSIVTRYEYQGGRPVLMREPKVFFVDNFAGKAVGINLFIGRRPSAAFGNSSGDREMLEWTTAGEGVRLGMLVLHDDGEREYAYGPAAGLPASKVGTFPQSLLDEAKKQGWIVISMKNDWKRIFPHERE
jgi:phosphoserine phosphatase